MWLWIATAAICIPSAALLAWSVYALRYDSVYASGWQIMTAVVGGVMLVAGVLLLTFTVGGRAYNRIECRSFAANTGRDTKFVVYTSFDYGTCLTPSGNGKWIPTDNLREFGSR